MENEKHRGNMCMWREEKNLLKKKKKKKESANLSVIINNKE